MARTSNRATRYAPRANGTWSARPSAKVGSSAAWSGQAPSWMSRSMCSCPQKPSRGIAPTAHAGTPFPRRPRILSSVAKQTPSARQTPPSTAPVGSCCKYPCPVSASNASAWCPATTRYANWCPRSEPATNNGRAINHAARPLTAPPCLCGSRLRITCTLSPAGNSRRGLPLRWSPVGSPLGARNTTRRDVLSPARFVLIVTIYAARRPLSGVPLEC